MDQVMGGKGDERQGPAWKTPETAGVEHHSEIF